MGGSSFSCFGCDVFIYCVVLCFSDGSVYGLDFVVGWWVYNMSVCCDGYDVSIGCDGYNGVWSMVVLWLVFFVLVCLCVLEKLFVKWMESCLFYCLVCFWFWYGFFVIWWIMVWVKWRNFVFGCCWCGVWYGDYWLIC